MDSLRLYFLGRPHIERRAEPVEVDTRKAIALLAFLASTREPQTRERLAGPRVAREELREVPRDPGIRRVG